jgi:hypothetical protein
MNRLSVALAMCLVAASVPVFAQEMDPKSYAASPVGATFIVGSVARSTGSVLLDPTLPVTDVQATINATVVGVGTTFGLFGKLALISAAVPYSWGEATGQVQEQTQRVTRSGMADARLKLSVNLRGNNAARVREFMKTPRRTIVGASLAVATPTGQYDGTKLINLGNNRWAFKPEVGVAIPRGRWDIDAYAGAWFFTSNSNFFPGGRTRTQDPLVTLQGHVSYTIKPRLWVAVNSTWYAGGAANVTGQPPGERFENTRIGATLSIPAGRTQSFKVAFSNGVTARTGTDFRTIAVGWQWLQVRP